MDAQWKKEIKQVMTNYLTSLGWPNVPNPDDFAFSHVESMFKILLKANLVKYADWNSFYIAAENEYTKAQLRRMGVPV